MKKVVLSLTLALMLVVLALGLACADGSMSEPLEADLGDYITGELSKTNLTDYYGLELSKSGLLTLRLASQATHNRFTLFDENGTQIWSAAYDWDSEAGQSNQIVQLNLVSGSYVLEVSPDANVESANVRAYGTYEFLATNASANETYTESLDENNNTFAAASEVDLDNSGASELSEVDLVKTINGQIAVNDAIDFYRMDYKGNDLTISVTSKTAEQRFVFYNAAGAVIWAQDLNAVNGTITLTQKEANLASGEYYFSVGYISGKKPASQGNYTLKLTSHKHVYKKEVINKATPTADGSKVMTCKCGAIDASKTTKIAKPYKIALENGPFTYNGSAIKPTLIVMKTKTEALSKKYYSFKRYGGKKNVGTYTVEVKLKGDLYTGTINLDYDILPMPTKLLTVTPRARSFSVTWKAQTKQTNGYLLEYSTSSKFTTDNHFFTIQGNNITSYTVKGLVKGQKYYVRIAPFTKIGSKTYYSIWSGKKSVIIP